MLVENAEVIDDINNTIIIRSIDARETEGVPVRFDGWPPNEMPEVNIGDRVEVMGKFIIRPASDNGQEFFISVKYDTKDYIRVL